MAALGLCCCMAFSLCGEQVCSLLIVAWASHCSDSSCCGAQPEGTVSVVAAPGLSSCGQWALLLCSMWDLSGPGIKSMSPVSAVKMLYHWTTREARTHHFWMVGLSFGGWYVLLLLGTNFRSQRQALFSVRKVFLNILFLETFQLNWR